MFRALRRFAAAVRARLSMPLLRKELAETAARPRTYTLRVVYALALYGIFALIMPRNSYHNFSHEFSDPSEQEYLMGLGRQVFQQLNLLQLSGIALFLPALMCGRITQEKERDSLVLLFLTELRPWEIVLQKYLGGLVPMFSFLLLGLPLAGVAYALGGLESQALADSALSVVLCTLQVGALTLMCSAWCRTTVGALISSYLAGVVFYGGVILTLFLTGWLYAQWSDNWPLLFIPPNAIEIARTNSLPMAAVLTPSIFSIFVFLLLARVFLVRRAFVPALNFLPRLFARIDRWMKSANRITGNVVLYGDSASLPVDEPVFWRDTHRRALGKAHYLFRLLCAMEVPTVLLCMFLLLGTVYQAGTVVLTITAGVLALLTFASLTATAANSLVSERVGQTLEVMLTTPLSAWAIVRQKARALRRLEWVLAVPLLTVIACHAFMLSWAYSGNEREPARIRYFVCAASSIAIYLPMTTWLSLWIGLWVRTRFQAILTALGAMAFWIALAPLLFFFFDKYDLHDTGLAWLLLASPASVPFLNEVGELQQIEPLASPWFIIAANAVLYLVIGHLIRLHVRFNADRRLRR